LQLAAAALGGRVRTNPRGREIGVARGVALTEAGRGHPMLAGRPAVFEALCFHLDEVEAPPPGAEVLAGNAMSAVQAMALRTPGRELPRRAIPPRNDLWLRRGTDA
jgi:GMP synthase (glutamine-hydrolysing)